MSGRSKTVVCASNVPIADFLCAKREESRRLEKNGYFKILDTACNSLFAHPTPITNLHDAKQVKNIGPWIMAKLKDFFDNNGQPVEPSSQERAGTKEKAKKRYCPRIRTAAYALLITLLRAHQSGKEFMRKKELIDAADSSGLSEKPIRTNPISWNSGQPNSKDWYSGWSGMKTLTEKCLVVKSSNPGKYKLTDEGKLLARECLQRAGLSEENSSGHGVGGEDDVGAGLAEGGSGNVSSGQQDDSYSDEDIQEIQRSDLRQRNNAHYSNPQSDKEGDRFNFDSSQKNVSVNRHVPPTVFKRHSSTMGSNVDLARNDSLWDHDLASPANVHQNPTSEICDPEDELPVPPLEGGEKFSDVYDIICILDRREKFRGRGNSVDSLLLKFADSLAKQFKVEVEIRQLPVGDALWIARHKQRGEEYVLDFVVERKQVGDLWNSIKDNRYKQQKLHLMNCGLKRLLYLVEGDVNTVEATDSLKTAMFTTEIQGGFHLMRTSDTNDTCKQYGHLTLAIINRYKMEVAKGRQSRPVCKTFKDFSEHCKNLERDRVTDVFCLQLTQVNHVTEDIALSIQDQYPTIFSLIQAYTKLEGQEGAQEKLLQGIPIRNTSKAISSVMSKNIYKLVWAP